MRTTRGFRGPDGRRATAQEAFNLPVGPRSGFPSLSGSGRVVAFVAASPSGADVLVRGPLR